MLQALRDNDNAGRRRAPIAQRPYQAVKLVCDLLSGVFGSACGIGFDKGSNLIPWETQSFRRPISAVSTPIITDYQTQQLAVHANHQRQRPNGWHEKSSL
jgi:hypothetical protein